MKLIDRLFNNPADDLNSLRVKLGRFTDAYKSESQLDHMDRARQHWDSEQYKDALLSLLKFMYEENQNNVVYGGDEERVDFSVHQGSRSIYGHYIPKVGIRAHARIAQIKEFSIGYLRSLVERNGRLLYCRYTITPDNEIRLELSLPERGTHPDRLYYALKELALHSDKLDDLLLEEFSSLSAILEDHQTDLPEKEVSVKIEYYQNSVDKALKSLRLINASPKEKIKIQQYIGLSFIYKIEYLVSPEGLTRERIEKIHHDFWAQNKTSLPRKVKNLTKAIDEMSRREKEALRLELYDVSTTFGLTNQTDTDTFKSFIDEHWPSLINYAQRRDQVYTQHICDFIIGYALFNYGLPLFLRQLLDLYFRVREEEYFVSIGFKRTFCTEQSTELKDKAIDVAKKILSKQKQLMTHTQILSTDDMMSWSISFIAMLRQML